MSVAPASDAAPKAAVFLTYAAADEHAIFRIAEEISRCGAAVFLDAACIRPDAELHVLNALSFADEVLILITATRVDSLNTRSTPAFLEGRLVGVAIAVARALGVPIRGLLEGISRKEVVEDSTIPRFITDGPLFDTVDLYVADLLKRRPRALPKLTPRLGLRCRACLCHEGHSNPIVARFEQQLKGVGFELDEWRPTSSVDRFDAAVVLPGGEPSEDWKTRGRSFLEDFVRSGKPVALLAQPGAQQQPEVLDLLPPASRIEYSESDNLSFLQLVWTIVGYRHYDMDIVKKLAPSADTNPPRVFISYSWDDDAHKAWVASLATRLRADGVNVSLDQWEVRLGDQLTQFMESSVRDSDFVLIICTPRYKERSNQRRGGVGYEGHIITAEVFYAQNQRKFIPVLRFGEWVEVAPTWLLGKNFSDLCGDPYRQSEYQNLKNTILQMLPEAPPIGRGAAGS